MTSRAGVSIACTLAAVLAACGHDRPAASASAASSSAACPSRAAGSRWASAGAPYRRAATYGGTREQWLYEVGGTAYRDSLLYVYDAAEGRVLVLTAGLRPAGSFGRKGRGPGELIPTLDWGMKGRGWRWLDVAGDTVAVFDGTRLQLFSRRGEFLEQRLSGLVGTPALSERMERIAWDGAAFVGSSGGYVLALLQPAADRYRWDLTVHGPRSHRRLLSLKLAPLPARGSVPFNGPGQARPLWDHARGCVVATDGTGAWLVRASVAGGRVDTLPLRLPAVRLPRIDRDELARLMGAASKGRQGYLGPTAVRRLSGLAIDPDGYAWLLLTQDSTHVAGGGVEVVRVALSTGAAERDTVPAFPAAFGEPGVFYARTNDRLSGEAVVTRYDRGPAP